MNEPAVRFEHVTRSFGKKIALDRIDLTVDPGSILGLVGRNGAGKTTALRLAHGILFADSGRIRVFGLDPVTQGIEVRQRASLLSEESALYPWMTVGEILGFAAALHPRWDRSLAETYRRRLDLDPAARIRSLSRGTRAKVALALAVSCRPDLLLLDDPTAGLDPLVRREVLEGILEVVPAEGGAVIYASHLVHDIERVADHIALLDEGRLRFSGALEDLKGRVRRATAVFESDVPPGALAAPLPGRIDARADGRVLNVVSEGANGDLVAALRSLGARQVVVEPLSLEEILVAFLREGRESAASRARPGPGAQTPEEATPFSEEAAGSGGSSVPGGTSKRASGNLEDTGVASAGMGDTPSRPSPSEGADR
jgi:ABC-2 type transport system ATP-binding protein